MMVAVVEMTDSHALLTDLLAEYTPALGDYLSGGGESPLERAYEFGRKAFTAGLGVLDMATIHQQALVSVLTHALTAEERARIARAAVAFFIECISPYEMALRGYREANLSLRRLNENLEKQVAERTRELQQAVRNLSDVLDGTVQSLASLVESRDPYTMGHSHRVTELVCAIGREMNLSGKQLEGLRVAALLHDVGKIAVPSDILNKPGKLSEAEFSIIKLHPAVGYEVLRGIPFPWPVAEAVVQHHERLDGSGYPHGLRDGQILLEARILGVSDVVEAISSHRPYRPALGIDRALQEIQERRGTLYDGAVVDTCLKVCRSGKFSFARDAGL